jgi:hypothetical protein
MNACAHWDSLISRHVDGELSADLDAHVNECLRCRERLRQERLASATLREMISAPHESLFDLESRIVSSTTLILEESNSDDRRVQASRRTLPAGSVAAAAAFVVGALIWLTLSQGGFLNGPAPLGPSQDSADEVVKKLTREPGSGESAVVELRRDSRLLSPITILSAATTARPETQVNLPQLGLERSSTLNWIIEPDPSSFSSAAPAPAGREPRWSIQLETVQTRLVRYKTQTWH